MNQVRQSPAPNGVKRGVALTLTFAAGFVDIVGFLSVYRLFTAHMTGTTVHLADYIVHRKWSAAAAGAIVVCAFFFGSVTGRILIEVGARKGIRRIASCALGIEALLLACVFPTCVALKPRSAGIYSALVLLAAAMGMQTAALTKIGPLTVHTTFVTGMLNRLAELVTSLLFRKRDLRQTNNGEEQEFLRQKIATEADESYFLVGIWFLYMAGASAGTLLSQAWHLKALYIPCALLIVAIAIDQIKPLSIEEQKQQFQL